jgi:A/G-specific adenine glycosylase
VIDFAPRLLTWFDLHGRHDLPWQHPRSAYFVWLSEIMLQQTQVGVVAPYFQRFVDALPDLPALAAAPLDQVFALWSGMGYYSRARNLHRTAQICIERHASELPTDFDALLALPGIGRSTAGAILAQAHGLRFPILDGNVRRVLCRHRGVHGWPGDASVQKQLWSIAESLLPSARLADYTQALMDFGATVCTRSRPACASCPFNADCVAWRDGVVSRLPESRPGKALPTREAIVLLLRDDNERVLLARRPPSGVWASLWSLPEFATREEADFWLQRNAHADPQQAESLRTIEHGFSHYRLRLHPLQWRNAQARDAIGDTGDLRWQAADQLDRVGLPAPIRKLLQATDR